MALDRAWYNSLVDDDSSGLTGSVWDKADVDALMDAVDAEIARIDASVPTWQDYAPGTGSLTGGSIWTVPGAYARYAVLGKTVFLRWALEGTSISVASSSGLYMSLPLIGRAWGAPVAVMADAFIAGGHEAIYAGIEVGATNSLQFFRLGGQTIPVGALTIRGQMTYEAV